MWNDEGCEAYLVVSASHRNETGRALFIPIWAAEVHKQISLGGSHGTHREAAEYYLADFSIKGGGRLSPNSAKLFWAEGFSVKGGGYPQFRRGKIPKALILAFFGPFLVKLFTDLPLRRGVTMIGSPPRLESGSGKLTRGYPPISAFFWQSDFPVKGVRGGFTGPSRWEKRGGDQ